MTTNDGGAAFPEAIAITPAGDVFYGMAGMTLRDWLAGQALAGILSGGFADTIPHDDINGGSDAAHFAYLYADAMLKARGA
ncbi:hypothetical protein [Aurantimonas sp. NFXS3]|uniref:hypothetical protein n=1 Tax=Aurantimonas sp. NFXS3 TaxID=2818434 RepID=UPI003B8D36AF